MDTSKIKEISQWIVEVKNAGSTVWGGYIDKTGAPGPKRLIGGNVDAGFFGEVPTSDLITGDKLAARIGLTGGVSIYSNEPWLKFSYLGNIEYIAKKPFRTVISWDQIDKAEAVSGYKIIEIKGCTYRVRLAKGKAEGKQNDSTQYTGSICYNSEWNRLMLPIHKNAPSNWKYPENVNSPTENWEIGYSNNDLSIGIYNNSYSWCQEYGDSTERLTRGGADVSHSLPMPSYNSNSQFVWRPVLELVR